MPKRQHDLSDDDIVSIRIAASLGLRIRHLSRLTGVHRATVHRIARRKTHIEAWSPALSPFEDLIDDDDQA